MVKEAIKFRRREEEPGIRDSEIFTVIRNAIMNDTKISGKFIAQIDENSKIKAFTGKGQIGRISTLSEGMSKWYFERSIAKNEELQKKLVGWVKEALKVEFECDSEAKLQAMMNKVLTQKVKIIVDSMLIDGKIFNPQDSSVYIEITSKHAEFEEKSGNKVENEPEQIIQKRAEELGITDGEIFYQARKAIIEKYNLKIGKLGFARQVFDKNLLDNPEIKKILASWVKSAIESEGIEIEKTKNSDLKVMVEKVLSEMIHKEKIINPIRNNKREKEYLKIISHTSKFFVVSANRNKNTIEMKTYNREGLPVSVSIQTEDSKIGVKRRENLVEAVVTKKTNVDGQNMEEKFIVDLDKGITLDEILEKVQKGEMLEETSQESEDIEQRLAYLCKGDPILAMSANRMGLLPEVIDNSQNFYGT